MKEAVNLLNRNSRRRKAPYRPNSISSEWIALSETPLAKVNPKKTKLLPPLKSGQSNIPKKNKKSKQIRKLKTIKNLPKDFHNFDLPANGDTIGRNEEKCVSKKQKAKDLLHVIENSYQNIYFNRCKSYRKAKVTDIAFEFDFSTFESHNPDYPSALEDINTKICRTNSFWKIVSES